MSDTQHTPGPWVMRDHPDDDCPVISIGPGDTNFASGYICVYRNHKANARLIHAAPDLLEALTEITDTFACVRPKGCTTIKKVRAAIAKAKGTT